MTPVQRFEWALFNAGLAFKKDMEKSIAQYIQSMNVHYHYVRTFPLGMMGVRKRLILRERTRLLIIMDRKQLQAAQALEISKNLAEAEFKHSLAPKTPQSAWFGGEYDERTYY